MKTFGKIVLGILIVLGLLIAVLHLFWPEKAKELDAAISSRYNQLRNWIYGKIKHPKKA